MHIHTSVPKLIDSALSPFWLNGPSYVENATSKVGPHVGYTK